MNELRVLKYTELRKKIWSIPAKLILSLLLLVGLCWHIDPTDYLGRIGVTGAINRLGTYLGFGGELVGQGTGGEVPVSPLFLLSLLFEEKTGEGLETLLIHMKENPLPYVFFFVAIYGLVSYLYYFIRLMGHFIVGIAVGIIVLLLAVGMLASQLDSIPAKWQVLAIYVLLFGGPVLDLLHIFKYNRLRSLILHYDDNRAEDAFESGYDKGFRSGLDRQSHSIHMDDWDAEDLEELEEDPRDFIEESEEDWDEEDDDEVDCARDVLEDEEEEDRGYRIHEKRSRADSYARRKARDSKRDRAAGAGRRSAYESADTGRFSREAGDTGRSASFFHDCKDEESIRRRYRDLCKIYHPDSGNGSAQIFYQITEEYNRLLGK